MSTVIVTGGAGFIGSHVTDLLIGRGHQVHVIDDLSTGRRANLDRRAKLHVADIRSPRLPALFGRIRPSAVVHLAAQISVRRSTEDPIADADINIIGALNVLRAARAAGVRHVVFASSAAAYGSAKVLPTPETAPLEPSSPYGIAKAAFERYLIAARAAGGPTASVLRFANVYGPRQNSQGEAGVVAIFIDRLSRGRKVTINGDGRQTRDFVYAGDVARAVVSALEKRVNGVFNISTGIETSINRILAELSRIFGSPAKPVRGPSKPNEDRRSCLDPARAAAALGWKAATNVADGLRLTVEAAGRRR